MSAYLVARSGGSGEKYLEIKGTECGKKKQQNDKVIMMVRSSCKTVLLNVCMHMY